MDKEVYVFAEIAKLLKEKGFDWNCITYYRETPYGDMIFTTTEFILQDYNHHDKNVYSAPTHQMVFRWLREVHNILITIIPQEIAVGVTKLCYGIYRITEDGYTPLFNGNIKALKDSYENIEETVLKYVLNNLILL